jgi:hypothetical protein
LIKARMSSARQAVHRAESLIGFGKRPDFTPSHQHVFPTGMTLSTWGRRKNPVSGMSNIEIPIYFSTSDCSMTGGLMSRRISLAASSSDCRNAAMAGLTVLQSPKVCAGENNPRLTATGQLSQKARQPCWHLCTPDVIVNSARNGLTTHLIRHTPQSLSA